MPQSPETPVTRRLHVLRRRIAAATLATFVAAWLAVAALGKGGATSTAPTSPSSTTGTSSQNDGGASSAQRDDSESDGFAPSQRGDGPDSGADSGSSQGSSQQGGPVTTGQS